MAGNKIKLSIGPAKLIFILIIVAVVSAVFFLRKSDSQRSGNRSLENEKEMVLPRETGVADSGFEKKNASIAVLNAKVIYDNLEKINGGYSLKLSFSDRPTASAKIGDYFNSIEEGKFYRLSFWARTDSDKGKKIELTLADGEKSQGLGEINLNSSKNVQYYEFNFQAENAAEDLVLTSSDGIQADIWLDDFLAESLEIGSADQLRDIKPTIFGDTSWRNTDQNQTEDDKDSEELLSEKGSKIGQIFQPRESSLSGAALKVQEVGTGGEGNYVVQLREYDQRLGIISDEVLASGIIYNRYLPSIAEEIIKKEKQMRAEFVQNEKDIKEEKVPNDETTGQYPPTYTQQQIDQDKVVKRQAKLELAVREMKESYNVSQEVEIPLSARLDTNKKYWIGIDNSGVKVDANNYMKVFYNSQTGSGNEPGFVSDSANTWKEYNTLWFKTFYPRHSEKEGKKILSGATLSDFGNGKMLYRYAFSNQDYSSLSGFPGRKIYDMDSGNFKSSDAGGNYLLSGPDQYAIYKFNTAYPAKKVTLRDVVYNQSIGIDFSSDGRNWQEVLLENPSDNNQKADPLVINPEEETSSFYLRIKPDGNDCIPISLSVEAELGACASSGCGIAAEEDISSESQPQEENNVHTLDVAVYNGSETKGLAGAIADRISEISQIQVVKKSNAKGNYDKNIVVDLTGNNGDKADEISVAIGGEVGSLPENEEKPDADILIIGAALDNN